MVRVYTLWPSTTRSLPLHQLYPHRAGQEGVLEVGGVEDSRRQHHDVGIVLASRGHRLQRGAKHLAVLLGGLNGMVVEQPAAGLGHGRPVLDHIGDTAGAAQVVLQHPVPAAGVSHHVDPGHVAMRGVGHSDAHGVAFEALRRHHQPPGHHAVGDGGCTAVVQVGQEAVEGRDPLAQAPGQLVPFGGGYQPGEEIHGPDALGSLLLAVDGECDPLAAELVGDEVLEPLDLVDVQFPEPFDDAAVGVAHRPVIVERLVERADRLVPVEQPASRLRHWIDHGRPW